jgi:hypothetical protein
LTYDPLHPPKHSLAVVKAYYKNPGSGLLNQQLFKNDHAEWLELRKSAIAYGFVTETNLAMHSPAPRNPAPPAPAEEAFYSVSECREISKTKNMTAFAKDEPLMYALYQQSLSQNGLAVQRVLEPAMQGRVDNLRKQLLAERAASTKSEKLTDIAKRQSELDKEKQSIIAPVKAKKEKDVSKQEESIDWTEELRASEARQKEFDQKIADLEKALAHASLDIDLSKNDSGAKQPIPAIEAAKVKAEKFTETVYHAPEAKDVIATKP